jgi:hypothetical protein
MYQAPGPLHGTAEGGLGNAIERRVAEGMSAGRDKLFAGVACVRVLCVIWLILQVPSRY